MVKARPGLSEQRPFGEPAAGNGMLGRRVFLEGAVVTGAAVAGVSSASAEPLVVESWMKEPGAGFTPYGQPSRFEDKVVRAILSRSEACRAAEHCRKFSAWWTIRDCRADYSQRRRPRERPRVHPMAGRHGMPAR